VLLATGGTPRTLSLPGAELEGVFVLRSLAHAAAIIAAAGQAKSAVVVGASFIGMEVAAALRQRNIEVHVITPDSVPMVRVFGERIGRLLQGLHQAKGVVFHTGTTPAQIVGRSRVEAVVLADGTRIATDLVVAGIGVQPAVGFLQETGLVEGGAIPVDARLATKAPGVFAAGDIAIVPGHRTGEPQRVEHWVVAERQGQHAARALLGRAGAYAEVPFFWTKQYDTSIKYIGFARGYDQVAYRGTVEEGRFVAGYYQGGALKAVAGCGMTREVLALGQMLSDGKAVAPELLQDEGTDLIALRES
jgi:3-phenylpropionate/trans-cinnamate dioxygenase ferredoxin reductase subunit